MEPATVVGGESGVLDAVARDLQVLAAATDRLLARTAAWEAEELGAPSVLPGWSRAHVLTHLARNADGLRNVLLSARTGWMVPMYASRALRDADIDAGARRPAPVVLDDVRASAERFAIDAADLGELAWLREVSLGASVVLAATIVQHRVREVEAHHVDLAAGYTFADLPMDVVLGILDQVPLRFSGSALDPSTLVATDARREWRIGTAGGGPRVSGPVAALLPWVMGRGGPDGLTSDGGPVPASPGWG